MWSHESIEGFLAQKTLALAGVSRSGATISSGMMVGVKREEVVRFAFLLFIPAILGATLFELKNVSCL
jgi:undecaprenyl-diphosphatase